MSSGLRGDPIKEFIHQILIPMRTSESSFSYKPPTGAEYSLKWALHNASTPPSAELNQPCTSTCNAVVVSLQGLQLRLRTMPNCSNALLYYHAENAS
jgi:hypothetical protein